MKIKPYLEAVEGIETVLKTFPDIKTEFFFLDDVKKIWKSEQLELKGTYQRRSIIAVGPEAVLFLKSNPSDASIIKVFTMISNPSSLVLQGETSFCGYFFSINANEQVRWISRVLPKIRSLGILYDQQHNQAYASKARESAAASGIDVKSLIVKSRDEVPGLLRKNWNRLDGLLLIPDATVVSASLVKYIIKDGISNNVPVIGYNRFFIRSGAVMAFVYNYRQIGRETAYMVRELLLNSAECQVTASKFSVEINQNIARHLNMDVAGEFKGAVIETNE